MTAFTLEKRLSATFDLSVAETIKKGELVALYGPSGSGKTTLLRLLAGLTRPDRGNIRSEGERWVDVKHSTFLGPQRRPIGMVFQEYALFPRMTVEENLRFALAPGQSAEMVTTLLDRTELTAVRDQYPATLSGGQRQRTALARALVQRPRLLLLDEPLSALDPVLRLRLGQLLRELHETYELSTLLVSHDQAEIARFADRVWLLENGRLSRSGTPAEVFGITDRLRGVVVEIRDATTIVLVGGALLERPREADDHPGREVEWGYGR